MRLSGRMITAGVQRKDGRQNTITSFGMPKILNITLSTGIPWIGSLIWRQVWLVLRKAARGKFPTDSWWHTIVATNGKEKTGYPTQKPLGIINRIVRASSNPGELVLDFFAGSGTVGESCLANDRRFILIDNNPQALEVMQQRFKNQTEIEWITVPMK